MRPAIEESKRVLNHHSKSFAAASRLLSADCRDDVAVVYAWCRRVDDAVDHCTDSPWQVLRRLREELNAVYQGGNLDDDGLAAFRDVIERRAIPIDYPRALLRGMQMDVEGFDYRTFHELQTYCFRVAGTVGLMMCHVLGVREAEALPHAAALGIGMQLTNVCRDVAEDWERHRLYLPRELLAAVGISAATRPQTHELSVELADSMRPVVAGLLDVADDFYRRGDAGIRYLSPRSGLAVRSARLIYAAIGGRVRATRCDVRAGRAHLGKGAKLGLCLRAASQTLWSRPWGFKRLQGAQLIEAVSDVARAFPL